MMIIPWVAAGCFAWAAFGRNRNAPRDRSFPAEREDLIPQAIAAAMRQGLSRDEIRVVAVAAVWPEYHWPPGPRASAEQWGVWEHTGAIVCRSTLEAGQ
jgi:hypothetical protein